jgi:hypothetical protein
MKYYYHKYFSACFDIQNFFRIPYRMALVPFPPYKYSWLLHHTTDERIFSHIKIGIIQCFAIYTDFQAIRYLVTTMLILVVQKQNQHG